MIDLHFSKQLLTTAKGLTAGDAVSIGYLRDRTTILGYKITHIVGAGGLRKEEAKK